jgi:hypothetical protein
MPLRLWFAASSLLQVPCFLLCPPLCPPSSYLAPLVECQDHLQTRIAPRFGPHLLQLDRLGVRTADSRAQSQSSRAELARKAVNSAPTDVLQLHGLAAFGCCVCVTLLDHVVEEQLLKERDAVGVRLNDPTERKAASRGQSSARWVMCTFFKVGRKHSVCLGAGLGGSGTVAIETASTVSLLKFFFLSGFLRMIRLTRAAGSALPSPSPLPSSSPSSRTSSTSPRPSGAIAAASSPPSIAIGPWRRRSASFRSLQN